MNLKSRFLIGVSLALAYCGSAFAQDKSLKIGVLTDLSGFYTDVSGAGSVLAAQMAVEDSGLEKKGWKIDVLSGDHQNKADIGVGIARQWFDRDKVDVVADARICAS